MIETMLARQAIFDKNLKVIAYELLYRKGDTENANVDDGNKATADVLTTALAITGVEKLSSGKKLFVNFTKDLIMEQVPTMMSPKHMVVEILEDVEPDEEFIKVCMDLKKKGFQIALDDFVQDEAYEEIADIVDIIKVDFIKNNPEQRRIIYNKYKDKKVMMLAEKIETLEEFEEAKSMGYTAFQGFFFEKPSIVQGKDIVALPDSYIKILNELQGDNPEYNKIAKIVESDISISYKLLRLINSPAFYTNHKIESIQHALVLLGFSEIQKWISLLLLRDVGKNKPNEVLRVSLIRAKMGENLAGVFGMAARKRSVFLMGMFSMADVLTGQQLAHVLEELPLEDDVKGAILGENNSLHTILQFIFLYEKADWDTMLELARKKNIPTYMVSDAYMDAVKWVNESLEI